jgi:hypothetical protein
MSMAAEELTEQAAEKPSAAPGRKRAKKKKRRAAKGARRQPGVVKARISRSFPASTFEEAIVLAEAFQRFAPGQQKVRRLTLFDKLDKSADSGPSRQLVTNSSRYGLTKGSYKAEFIELTSEGSTAVGDDVAPAVKLTARFTLSIKQIEPFNFLYGRCKGNKLPSKEFLVDALKETSLEEEAQSECVDTFIINVKFLGLLRTLSGTERLITIEHALEELGPLPSKPLLGVEPVKDGLALVEVSGDFARICFYISPIGPEQSDQRQHSDFFMEYIVEPALKEFNLTVIRADQIGKAGMIGKQVLEHVLRSRLVIADLSFHNPNVFYELCLRHATRLPTVQVVRAGDGIPFDIDQYRTISIDTRNLYTFFPKLQTYISEISNQVRRALEDSDAVDNPISMYYPGVKLTII